MRQVMKKSFFVLGVVLMGSAITVNAQEIQEMSEEEVSYSALPDQVKQSYENSNFSDWEVEEVEKVKTNRGTLYELEVENEDERYFELYYSPKGKLKEKEEVEHSHDGDHDH